LRRLFGSLPTTTSEPGSLGVTLDTALIEQLRAVLRGAPTTESELRQLWQSADGWARALQGQIAGSERRLRMLARGPSPPLAKIAPELQRIETLRPQLTEMNRLLSDLERRARAEGPAADRRRGSEQRGRTTVQKEQPRSP